ncbi:hypothetical protein FB561_3537 [Kribbella amoyensis]|uniref:Glyoxalase-like domain-containing protein n=1 Tax=Kribbella amoyensis TaxID=996641 RepID=A0A561BU41_9ACTN|nr:hypothetical protein FB561_3537 [Kribbella amoyensis]
MLEGGAYAWFEAPSLAAGAKLVARIVELGEALPDVDLRAGGVRLRIRPGVLERDEVELARLISEVARELGLVADPSVLQGFRVVIDARDVPPVLGFWRTALGYDLVGDTELADPAGRDPVFAIQQLDEPRPLRNRIHVDIGRPAEAVEAARTAVGQEPYGAYQLTLADAEGNEADVVPGEALTEDWRALFGAMTFYPTSSPIQASRLATAVAQLAEDAGWPLLVDIRPTGVTIDSGKDRWEDGVYEAVIPFAELAGRIQAAARELGLRADPANLRFVQLGFDAVDTAEVQAFWLTVLGYERDPRQDLTDIYDPRRLGPVIMFQSLDAADEERRKQRNRIHCSLAVPSDQAQVRIDAAVAAGGSILDRTPSNCTLADPEGNELTITTQA